MRRDVHAEALGRCAQASNTLLGFLVRATAVMDSGKYKLSSPMSNATTRSLAEVLFLHQPWRGGDSSNQQVH
jgi:hypothetical protein